MTDQTIIQRARKVAALMDSPVEGERIAATLKLKLIMEEHNLSMQDLGIASTSFNKSLVVSTSNSSNTELNPSDIKEVRYMHGNLSMWLKDMLLELTSIYDIFVIFTPDHTKIIGFNDDIQVFKHVIVHMRKFIEEGITKYGYTNEKDINGYARGVLNRVIDIMNIEPRGCRMNRKMAHITFYVRTHFNIRTAQVNTECNQDTYNTGIADAGNFKSNPAIASTLRKIARG
jgi:hypothetical protein